MELAPRHRGGPYKPAGESPGAVDRVVRVFSWEVGGSLASIAGVPVTTKSVGWCRVWNASLGVKVFASVVQLVAQTTRLVLPHPPATTRLSTDVSDRHMLDSHPVDPCRTPALTLDIPRPLPITVTLLCSPAIVFPTDVPDTSGPSYEMASLADPVTDPSVTATLVLPPRPIPPLHCTVVSDIHALISHDVLP